MLRFSFITQTKTSQTVDLSPAFIKALRETLSLQKSIKPQKEIYSRLDRNYNTKGNMLSLNRTSVVYSSHWINYSYNY